MARQYRLGPFRRLFNVAATVALRIGVAPPHNYLLTTTGRKTGRRYTTPVHLVEEADGARYLVAPYGPVSWVHNARAAGEVTLTRGRHAATHPVTEVGADEAAPVLKRYVAQVAVTRPFFDASKDEPVSAFVAEASRHPVFRLGDAR